MRRFLVGAALVPFLVVPALAGEMGAGGCNWSAKQVTAEVKAPVTAPAVDLAFLAPVRDFMRVNMGTDAGKRVATMIEGATLTQ